MKIVILSASPKKEASITLQVGRLIQKISELSVKDEFTEFIIGDGKYSKEIGDKVREADLVMFCSSIFHFNVHQQMMGFLDSLEADLGKDMIGKPVTYFTTSAQLMDTEPHYYMKTRLSRMGAYFIRSLSILDDDMLKDDKREEVGNWYKYVRSCALRQIEKFKDGNCVITFLDVTDGNNQKVTDSMKKAKAYLESVGVGKIKELQVRGHKIHPCVACSCCYIDGHCVIKDDFDSLAEEVYRDTDVLIIFGEVQYGSLGSIHKVFLDRHVQYGLYPRFEELICAYVLDMSNATSDDIMQVDMHSRANDNFGGDYYMGLCEISDDENLKNYCQDIVKVYNYELYPQRNFYSRAPYLIFKDLVWNLQKITAVKNFEYYSHADGGYKWPELNPNIQRFYDYPGAIQAEKNRLIPYKMILSGMNEDCSLKTKRRVNSRWHKPPVEEEPAKDVAEEKPKGLFGKFKKK